MKNSGVSVESLLLCIVANFREDWTVADSNRSSAATRRLNFPLESSFLPAEFSALLPCYRYRGWYSQTASPKYNSINIPHSNTTLYLFLAYLHIALFLLLRSSRIRKLFLPVCWNFPTIKSARHFGSLQSLYFRGSVFGCCSTQELRVSRQTAVGWFSCHGAWNGAECNT